MNVFLALLNVHALLAVAFAESSLQCLNADGNVVDWWFIYKANDNISYAYYDSDSTTSQTTLVIANNKSLQNQEQPLAYTLNLIWKNPNKYNFIAYNDEPPQGSSSDSYGHTKGVFAYDSQSSNQNGYFLIHSWPKFPDLIGKQYGLYGTASSEYAQTFLCISFKSFNTFNAIANQIRYNKPKVYNSSNLFANGTVNNFTQILNKKWFDSFGIYSFETTNGKQEFTYFAKSADWDNDLYEFLVSPNLKQSFIWETWRRNPPEPSFCKPEYDWNEMNVNSVTLGDGTHWKYTQDHGKSGCSVDNGYYVCVGDINRMYSQYNRGGGTACFSNSGLWNALTSAFGDIEYCNSTKMT